MIGAEFVAVITMVMVTLPTRGVPWFEGMTEKDPVTAPVPISVKPERVLVLLQPSKSVFCFATSIV